LVGEETNAVEHFYRRHLPHWELDGAWYYLTFRLHSSIPQAVFEAWQAELEQKRHDLKRRYGQLNPQMEVALSLEQARQVEHYLDSQIQIRHLEQPAAAEAFMGNLARGAEKLYRLGPRVVMPNHAHLILAPQLNEHGEPVRLARILQHVKGASALDINRALRRSGTLWQREYFDRVIRSIADFSRKALYVENNPVKSHLCERPEDWPWSSASRRLAGYELAAD
jgi:putative transposase